MTQQKPKTVKQLIEKIRDALEANQFILQDAGGGYMEEYNNDDVIGAIGALEELEKLIEQRAEPKPYPTKEEYNKWLDSFHPFGPSVSQIYEYFKEHAAPIAVSLSDEDVNGLLRAAHNLQSEIAKIALAALKKELGEGEL